MMGCMAVYIRILYQPNRLAESAITAQGETDFFIGEDMNRDFKGVWIPKEVYLDERLTALEKIIFVEIDSLDDGENGCFASNEYLADFCQCTKVKVSTAISKLIKLKYLEKAGFDGRRRILKSRLKLSLRQTSKKFNAEIKKVDSNNIDNKKENNIYRDVPDYLRDIFMEWADMRKQIKRPIPSENSVKRALSKLYKLSDNRKTQIAIIEQAIDKNWLSFYPLKEDKTEPAQKRYREFEPEPEIDAVPMPDETKEAINKFYGGLSPD